MIARLRSLLRALRGDEQGLSLIELALVLPVLLTVGLYGSEVAYMTIVDMQVSMIATSVADNASRLGQTDNSSVTPTVTETQINAVLGGALREGDPFVFSENGRIILSSLEMNSSTKANYIHWQRCAGSYARASAYGKQGAAVTTMGISGHTVAAQTNSAVMFVEVYYKYQPLFGSMFVSDPIFRHEAAFIIRDDRNLTPGVTGTAKASTCS